MRLGRYKASVTVNGESLLQRVVSRISFLSRDIIVVIAKGQQPPCIVGYPKLRIVTDVYAGKGPLAGIYTGLEASNSAYNLVVACDMPFLNRDLLAYMLEISAGFDAVVPRLGDMVEPLHAVYSKSCLPAIKRMLDGGRFNVGGLPAQVGVRYVEAEEIDRFDPEHLSFFNINTGADLKKASQLIVRESQGQSVLRSET